jgi:hypothetical protein
MVFVRMGDDKACNVLLPLLQKRGIGEKDIDAGVMLVREPKPAIDDEPFSLMGIEVEIDAKLLASPER